MISFVRPVRRMMKLSYMLFSPAETYRASGLEWEKYRRRRCRIRAWHLASTKSYTIICLKNNRLLGGVSSRLQVTSCSQGGFRAFLGLDSRDSFVRPLSNIVIIIFGNYILENCGFFALLFSIKSANT